MNRNQFNSSEPDPIPGICRGVDWVEIEVHFLSVELDKRMNGQYISC